MDFEQHRRAIGNYVLHTQTQAVLARVAGISERRVSDCTAGGLSKAAGPPGGLFSVLRGGADQ
jgi:hypothetical protein